MCVHSCTSNHPQIFGVLSGCHSHELLINEVKCQPRCLLDPHCLDNSAGLHSLQKSYRPRDLQYLTVLYNVAVKVNGLLN